MAARRRAGSFSPKTSRRLRISKVDMLDMACLLPASSAACDSSWLRTMLFQHVQAELGFPTVQIIESYRIVLRGREYRRKPRGTARKPRTREPLPRHQVQSRPDPSAHGKAEC